MCEIWNNVFYYVGAKVIGFLTIIFNLLNRSYLYTNLIVRNKILG